jgi:putative transposase
MARIARLVVPGIPHHITQRGNRRQQTFFSDEDYQEYIRLLSASCNKAGVEIWAYCLMPNHVHIIAVPENPDSLRAALGESHRRYTRRINFRHGWRGHLWQERFASYPMDEKHLVAAARYVELNPVKAKLTVEPEAYAWSSARAHSESRDDALVRVKPLIEIVGDWRLFLSSGIDEQEKNLFQKHERTGRPLGDDSFIERLEGMANRLLRKQKPGPKKTK